jgi:RNA polymerase sigma-70 factor (ECF subfamily)
MNAAEIVALPRTVGTRDYLEDTTVRRLTLDLYDREHIAIRRYLIFLGLTSEAAQEIVQDVFLKLHEHLLARGDRSNLRAWLYRVAHNIARNTQMAERASRTNPLESQDFERQLPAPESSAEERMLDAERQRRLREAIGALSPAQRECLMLRAQGLKYREIADALNLSVSTVGENVQRGLDKLRQML